MHRNELDLKTDALIGAWLANVRERKGISQEALGLQIGKGQSDVAKIEAGRKKVTVADTLKWMSALDVPIDDLAVALQYIHGQVFNKTTLWTGQ